MATELCTHSHSELPRPIFQIRPRMGAWYKFKGHSCHGNRTVHSLPFGTASANFSNQASDGERDNYNTSSKVHEYSLEEAKFRHELKHSKRSLSVNIDTFAFAFLLS